MLPKRNKGNFWKNHFSVFLYIQQTYGPDYETATRKEKVDATTSTQNGDALNRISFCTIISSISRDSSSRLIAALPEDLLISRQQRVNDFNKYCCTLFSPSCWVPHETLLLTVRIESALDRLTDRQALWSAPFQSAWPGWIERDWRKPGRRYCTYLITVTEREFH